jgi:hypothetical protein
VPAEQEFTMLHLLNRIYPVRYTVFGGVVLALVWSIWTLLTATGLHVGALVVLAVSGLLSALGLRDIT